MNFAEASLARGHLGTGPLVLFSDLAQGRRLLIILPQVFRSITVGIALVTELLSLGRCFICCVVFELIRLDIVGEDAAFLVLRKRQLALLLKITLQLIC